MLRLSYRSLLATLRARQSNNQGIGSLIHEYPFVYSMASYLWDVTGVLDQTILECRWIGVQVGVLEAVHHRLEQLLVL